MAKRGEKHTERVENMLYVVGYFIIVGGRNIKKKSVAEISMSELLRLKSAKAG